MQKGVYFYFQKNIRSILLEFMGNYVLKMLYKDFFIYNIMEYIYVGKSSIKGNMNMTTDEIHEIGIHLDKYKELFGLPENVYIITGKDLNLTNITINDKYICDYGSYNENKKLLTYIIFQTSGIITFYDNKKECEPNTIVIFPSEWFFPFKISQCVINIGNVFVDI